MTQLVTQDMFYAGVSIHGPHCLLWDGDKDQILLYSNRLLCCLENLLINTLGLQFLCLEIGEHNALIMELL